ncbi:E3 ubiquitin-protein ligase rnf213-alpha-like isoform X6 [Falco cherrug]|uniref:E3 ubiquitin-protein ligase rnf213-alpha-like isoform X6 n=1 Tax=Falco cherrug TaxID=345164 RepID=UPI0024788362|nr:E3 ubiquitin-protein ligase rnf213-alpha-like isoform X6 [Falco cherrug]
MRKTAARKVTADQVGAAGMEPIPRDGGTEELPSPPPPSQGGESSPSAGDEGDGDAGMDPMASDGQSSAPEGCEDVGTVPEEVAGDQEYDGDNTWEMIHSDSESSVEEASMVEEGDYDYGQDAATESLGGDEAPAVPPWDENQLQHIPVHHYVVVEEESYQNTSVHPKGALGQEEKHLGKLEKVPGHVKRVEMTNQGNFNPAGDQEIRSSPGSSTSRGGDEDAGDAQPSGMLVKSQPQWFCQPSPYLFSGPRPPQDTMTLEFVAVLAAHYDFDSTLKICVLLYKQPNVCVEFATMVKRKTRVITGSATIPLSDLQEVIFYKYGLVNTFQGDRPCVLEQISADNLNVPETFKHRNTSLYRVLNVPKTEIKADKTWTIFEHIECHFPTIRTHRLKLPGKSSRWKLQMEHLEQSFTVHTISWNFLENMERKLDRYEESSHVRLWDAEKEEVFGTFILDMELVKNSIRNFTQRIIKMKDPKLLRLLFAFHTLFRCKFSLSQQLIDMAGKHLEVMDYNQNVYEDLRGKSKYFPALKDMCLRTTNSTLWIWLVPLLYAINEKMEDSFLCELPSEAFKQLRRSEDKQREVLKMIQAHKTLIGRCDLLAKQVVEMLALKNFSRDPLPDIQLSLQLLLETLNEHIMSAREASLQVSEDDWNVALKCIITRMDSWLKNFCPQGSSKQCLKPVDDHEVLRCLNLVYLSLNKFLGMPELVPFSSMKLMLQILGLFADKEHLLQVNQEFQQLSSVESFAEFSLVIAPWLEKYFHRVPTDEKSFLKNMGTWQQLLSLKIVTVQWTGWWRGLIHTMFKEWMKKISDKHLIDFCLAFLKVGNNVDVELENCFMNRVIQCIGDLDKIEESKLNSMISVFLKMRNPAVKRLLSVLIEKMCSPMKSLESVNRFDGSTGPVLANLLNSLGICHLISTARDLSHKYQLQLSSDAQALLFQVNQLLTFVGHHLLLGDIPFSILRNILEHEEQFRKLLCTCDSSFSCCITKVLEVRKQEYEQLEQQKQQRCSFLQLCCSIEGVVKVDRSTVEKSVRDSESFKDQMAVKKFSIDGKSQTESHVLGDYSDMMQKLHVVERSQCFRRLWKMRAEQSKATGPEDRVFSIEDVQEKIYKPAIADFQKTYLSLKDFSITLGTLQSQFEKLLEHRDQLLEEFKIMEDSEGPRHGKAYWITGAVERIENYLTLSKVVNTAKIIDALRQMLRLEGDFQILSDLTKYEEQEFQKKRLDFMTPDLMNVKKSLSDIPQGVLDFLKALLECARKGFTSWIKTIIKDKTEIPVFVELASISAGENDMDIDRVRFFRDAMAASAPIVLDLSPTAGFDQFFAALSFIKAAIVKDSKLPKKLKDSCDNREWIQMVHDSHGSVERSSMSQARSINRNGIFTISAPPKFKAMLEDCISLRLLDDSEETTSPPDQKAKKYSLSQLTELQNKLMLIATKVEQGREEANRFLEILERVRTVGKLYLELLSIGNILFIDWKADIYCNAQQRVKLYTEFGIAGILVQSTRPLLEELDSLSKAMEHCLAEWKKYLDTQRNTYYHLNLFTAHQLFYLCSQLARVQKGILEPQVLIMLSVIKHNINEEDIKKALEDALMTPQDSVNTSPGSEDSVTWHDYIIRFPQLIKSLAESGYNESVAKAALQSCLSNSPITEQMLMDFAFEQGDNDELVEELSKLYEETRETFLQTRRKFKTTSSDADQVSFSTLAHDELATSFESLPSIYDKVNLLWDAYCKKFAGLVSDKYIGLDVFGETLKRLAALESTRIKRSLPVGYEAGKPLLVMCKEEEMLPHMLFIYRNTKKAPLPSYDEVLVCTPDTEEEEVELLVRRALSPGCQDEKIYCLLGADKLVYKVSKQLESHFFRLVQSSSIPNYRFIIFCNAKAHNSYVITAFDAYKVAFPCYTNAEIQTYLKMHLKVPSGTAPVAQAFEEPYQQNVKFVFSERAGMGKSLFVDNTIQKVRAQLGGTLPLCKTIRLMESEIDFQFFVEELISVKESVTENQPTIFHIDVFPVVSKGLYRLLIDLCILRHIQSPDGLVWKCKPSHLYLIEYLEKGRGVSSTRKQEISIEMEENFLEIFPTVECVSVLQVLSSLGAPSSAPPEELREEQFDRDKLKTEVFQRSYQYLSRYKKKQNLDNFTFVPGKVEGTEKECLECLMEFCGRNNPSWTELSNFTHFLNFQLRKCEKSVFCSPVVGGEFCGFKTFVIKFMIAMSKDFAMPSLNMSDESVPRQEWKEMDSVLRKYQLRRKWEQESHPYIVFHADDHSMEFLGFHINGNFDAIDAYSQSVLEKAVISKNLYMTLALQNVPFNKKFENLSRTEQLEALCRVFGVKYKEDPDASYQLTLDNTMKMLAIHLRFQCGIPVIIMGETGCGKTKLVQFMCNLQRAGRKVQNMMVVRVHGGTTSKNIQEKVRQAMELALTNEKEHNVDTVLFFDEANTSEAIFAIKEVLCDRSVNGMRISTDRLKVVAACNPYKRHTEDTIEKLEKAGLGYRVRSEDTPEKLGYIPLRQLVYRVQPLSPSLLPLVWDFGELNEKTQSLYIREIVKSTVETITTVKNLDVFTNVISASQKFLRERKDECRVASLRDIDRCMKIVLWFYNLRDLLFHQIDKKRQREEEEKPVLNDAQRVLALSVGVCYYVSLENRQEYLREVAKCFSVPASWLQQELELCQEVFLDNLSIPKATACNNALRENIFMMVVCMDLRVPLFLVGKPGSSKSLSKAIAVDAMQGTLSRSPLFKRCKEVQLVSFQCSPHSKPEGIISTFRQCGQFQKGKNLNEFASVVLLDEIGLAEDSPDMPLKALHPLLEDGCVDDENPEPYKKVGFVGISNWALDPAKMNRGLLVFRTEPSKEELVNTAKGICADQPHLERIEHLFPILANFYCNVLKTQETEFFGLRDFYSLIKMIVSYTQNTKRSSQEELLVKAIQRNFGGSRDIHPLEIFRNCTSEVRLTKKMETSCIRLLEENIHKQQVGFMSRYLLLLTTNNAAFQIIQMTRLIDVSNCDIIFGSGFPRDQDYSQVCRSVNRVKICMEIGRPVVLLNIQNLYESLYDALNQCFVSLGDNYYVDLGLGTHRVKSRVKEEFRLIVIEEEKVVYTQFPPPLLSRLEKHCLDMNTILNWGQQNLKQDLEKWAEQFVYMENPDSFSTWSHTLAPKEHDVFIGFSDDTSAAIVLESSQNINCESCEQYRQLVLPIATRKLVECATPDSILRLKYTDLEDAKQIQDLYFFEQKHNSLDNLLQEVMEQQKKESTARPCLQVSTHARLLNQKDLEVLRKTLNLSDKIHCLFLGQFDTEHAFRQDLRKIFKETQEVTLLLVQFHFDEPQSSKRLLACAKYCITDERRRADSPHLFHVVLITKVPRVMGGCSYLAFDSGEWKSVHLDDLMPSENFKANLGQLSKRTIAEIFMHSSQQHLSTGSLEDSAAPGSLTDSDLYSEENSQFLNVDMMIKGSIQKAVIQLEDKNDNNKRPTKRIKILHNLLFHTQSSVSRHFMTILKRRICCLLEERDKLMQEPREWIFRRALSTEFILEDTSFRQALWTYLEDTVVNVFAQILAVVDANNNLDHLSQGSPLAELWLQMFQEEKFLKIKYTRKVADAKISVLSMSKDPNTSLSCQFPFSWVLKAYLDDIWEKVYHRKGQPKKPTMEVAEFYQSFIKKVLMLDHSNLEMVHYYTNDFLRMTFPGQHPSVYEILSKVFLASAEQLCLPVVRKEMSFSLIWLHMEYFYLRDDYQLFVDIVRSNDTVISELQAMYEKNPPEMFVTLDALNILLKKVQPSEKGLLPFDACIAWLKSVKSIKPWVEWISLDNYQLQFYQKKKELLESVLHRWTCTNIVYMLIDHLLHNETQIDEKLLRLVVKQFIFLWNRLYTTPGFEPENTFDLVTKVLKKCNENADVVYLVKGVKECKSCLGEITDPAELPCSHIFCTRCILEWENKQCKICKNEFSEDYTPTASEATREAVACHNKFRRKCNSFFVEFITMYFLGDREAPSAKIIQRLIQFVACKPNPDHQAGKRVYKPKSELSPFEECMDTSPTIQSSLLKLMLRCGFDNVKVHLEEYLSQMEEKIMSNESNREHFYFMVVHCLEDFMYPSSQEDVSRLAENCLSTADLSAFCKPEVSRINTLQFIAQIRLSISHVATLLSRQLLSAAYPNVPAAEGSKKEQDLVNAMKNMVAKSPTPWPQVFLIRNLCDLYGLTSMWKILKVEKWILPRGVENLQDRSAWLNIPLMFSVLDKAQNQLKRKDATETQSLISVMRRMESILQLTPTPDELLEDKLKKIMDALGNSEDPSLLEVVFHTGLTLALFPNQITQLLKNICFKPAVVKGSYLPTMPGDLLFDVKNWKIGSTDKMWRCQCGSYWIVTNCGLPMERKKCTCGAIVGGTNHRPEAGFTENVITTDKTEKGYILESPLVRRNDSERCLSPACVSLARALLHSSLLLGVYIDQQAILDLMKRKPDNVEEFFWGHLQKDVACLAEALSRNVEDAVVTVHLFLQHLSNYKPTDQSVVLSVLNQKKDREEWETSFKALAQPFFQELEQSLNSVKEQRMNGGPHGSSLLLKIAYGQTPHFKDLPSQGLINQPCLWKYEQKMTIQTLMRFLQQEDGEGTGNPYPILLELLLKLENIQHIRHLPDIFQLQNALIHLFQNSHKAENYTVRQFLDQPGFSEDQRLAFSRAVQTIQKVWSNINRSTSSSGITVLSDALPNDITASTAVLHLLPTQSSISRLVTRFLIALQNSCIDTAAQVTRERQWSISAEEVKPSSVLAVSKSDLLTMALANLQYEIDEDGTKTTYFDFEMLQRQVVHRFISGKPIIKAQTAPSIPRNNVRTLQDTKMKVRDQLDQEPLSINQQKRIMEEARSVNAISNVLATLKVAAEFLAVTGGDPKRPLPEYIQQELRMDASAKQFKDVPVVPNTQLKHILSLWQVLAARRSMLLVQMNQDPFCLVPKQFQANLDAMQAKALSSKLSNTNLDLFLIELHEMIMVALSKHQPDHPLQFAFRCFLEDNKIPEDSVAILTNVLEPNIPIKNILSVWRTAAKTSQINIPAYGQERPAQGSH